MPESSKYVMHYVGWLGLRVENMRRLENYLMLAPADTFE